MGKIHVLPFEIANLIAAGEVVDRPASVIKELAENAIDAGATAVTIEIKRGGVTFMRVTDNGCGMSAEDMPTALRRHATSKISAVSDLNAILTLGFRGEALAAISSVAKVRILSKTASDPMGAALECHGGELISLTEAGCPPGTTVLVEDVFYNVPARRKFLKKDATEAAACSAVAEKIALSHPEIAIKYISDGEVKFNTSGDGNLKSVIYALFGREFALRSLATDRANESGSIRVHGFVSEPDLYRPNRNMEIFFINGRYVKSRTAQAAVEQAYASKIPHDKFPFCVLHLEISPGAVDVNVHPAKLEVKFTNEKVVFDAVYYAVCNALEASAIRPELTLSHPAGEPLPTEMPQAQSPSTGNPAVSEKVKESFWMEGQRARDYLNAFVPKDRPSPKGEQLRLGDNPVSAAGGQTHVPEEKVRLSDGSKISAELLEKHRAAVGDKKLADIPEKPDTGAADNLSVRRYMESAANITDNGQTAMFERAIPEMTQPKDAPGPESLTVPEKGEMDFPERAFPENSFPAKPVPETPPEPVAESRTDTDTVLVDAAKDAPAPAQDAPYDAPPYLILGEAYNTYVIVQLDDRLLMIDKHAAHERIIFDELCRKLHSRSMGGQVLLIPYELTVLPTEAAAITDYASSLESLGYGFTLTEQSVSVVRVSLTQIPDMLSQNEAVELFTSLVNRLTEGTGTVEAASAAYFETKLWQASCKAAIKGGRVYDMVHLRWLCDRLLIKPEKEGASVIRTCPHGRPVAFEIKKTSIERQFARLV